MFNSNTPFSMPVVPASYGTNNSGFGGFGSDWIGLIVILAILGWGGNGIGGFGGGFGGGRGYVEPCATQADVRAAVDQQTLINKLDQQTYGIADSTYALNSSITNGFNGVQQTLCQGFNGISREIADCCCQTQGAVKDIRYDLATQACDTRHAISDSTRDIIENQNANSRQLLDFLVNDKLATLQAENQSLRLSASQAEQNAFIRATIDASTAEVIRRTGNECPIPAYVVPNPNCCYNPFGFGYGSGYGSSSCGCGCA
jgi:hypothetical protein